MLLANVGRASQDRPLISMMYYINIANGYPRGAAVQSMKAETVRQEAGEVGGVVFLKPSDSLFSRASVGRRKKIRKKQNRN